MVYHKLFLRHCTRQECGEDVNKQDAEISGDFVNLNLSETEGGPVLCLVWQHDGGGVQLASREMI